MKEDVIEDAVIADDDRVVVVNKPVDGLIEVAAFVYKGSAVAVALFASTNVR